MAILYEVGCLRDADVAPGVASTRSEEGCYNSPHQRFAWGCQRNMLVFPYHIQQLSYQ